MAPINGAFEDDLSSPEVPVVGAGGENVVGFTNVLHTPVLSVQFLDPTIFPIAQYELLVCFFKESQFKLNLIKLPLYKSLSTLNGLIHCKYKHK